MSRTTLTRWTLATVVFLALGWLATTRSHLWALVLLVLLLVAIDVWGGSRRKDAERAAARSQAQPEADRRADGEPG
jgi:hypothetical protein